MTPPGFSLCIRALMESEMTRFAALPRLETERLILRAWCDADIDAFAAMNADAEVMRFFPGLMTAEDSRKSAMGLQDRFARHGLAPHAVAEKSSGEFLGFVGLSRVEFEAPVKGCVEIGWRLVRRSWGQGYAREAALEALRWGFEEVGLAEIVAFAPTINRPSIAVMKSIGMRRDSDGDFIHPALAKDSPLQPLEVWRKPA